MDELWMEAEVFRTSGRRVEGEMWVVRESFRTSA
jgi:hypothetical protein